MAPTTLINQKTTTTPSGRNPKIAGYPLHVSELLALIEGTAFVARGSLDSYKNIVITKGYIEKAFKYQIENKGFSFVEMLSPCPTDWGMSPEEALLWLRENMMKEYKLGVIKDKWRQD